MAKPKHARTPTVAAHFRELPGTQVGFWVVEGCPFCGADHFHAAGTRLTNPLERLGYTTSPCGNEYMLVRPQEHRNKKGKKANRRRADQRDLTGADDWFNDEE